MLFSRKEVAAPLLRHKWCLASPNWYFTSRTRATATFLASLHIRRRRANRSQNCVVTSGGARGLNRSSSGSIVACDENRTRHITPAQCLCKTVPVFGWAFKRKSISGVSCGASCCTCKPACGAIQFTTIWLHPQSNPNKHRIYPRQQWCNQQRSPNQKKTTANAVTPRKKKKNGKKAMQLRSMSAQPKMTLRSSNNSKDHDK